MIIVHNDFHQTHGLFPLFEGLSVSSIDKPYQVHTNGTSTSNGVNGTSHKLNGSENTPPLTNGA